MGRIDAAVEDLVKHLSVANRPIDLAAYAGSDAAVREAHESERPARFNDRLKV